MRDRYIPRWYKRNLVEWAINKYPHEPPTKFKKMKKDQLWAMWFNN